jgi:hypothetical protein
MEWLENLISNNFDVSFIPLVIIGNFLIYNSGLYPQKLLSFSKSKVILTFVNSLVLGIGYWFLTSNIGSTPPEIRTLLNSFLLSTTLYEFGIKESLQFLKENGSSFLVKKLKERIENDSKNS